jgi:SAM-dependent methyltransferase
MQHGKTATEVGAEHDRFWDTYSIYYDSVYRLMPYRKLLWDVLQALELEPGMRMLDAGCGTGNLEHFIAQKNPPPVAIEAIDFSPAMLSRARAKCAGLDYIRFTQANLDARLPFDDSTFDRIVSINVLYTLPNQDASVAEILRVLARACRARQPDAGVQLGSLGSRALPPHRQHLGHFSPGLRGPDQPAHPIDDRVGLLRAQFGRAGPPRTNRRVPIDGPP